MKEIPELSRDNIDHVMSIGYPIWNAVVLADLKITDKFLDQVMKVDASDIQALTLSLVQRKRSLFGKDLRVIGNFEYEVLDQDNINLKIFQVDPSTCDFF